MKKPIAVVTNSFQTFRMWAESNGQKLIDGRSRTEEAIPVMSECDMRGREFSAISYAGDFPREWSPRFRQMLESRIR